MAASIKSIQCSMCKKESKCICTGCQQLLCVKHFFEHRQKLSAEFDEDIARTHDELLEQIRRTTQSNDSSSDLFTLIDRWEKTTIDKIQKSAEEVRQQLIETLNYETENLTKQFTNLTAEIRRRREENDFHEEDLENLRQQINQLQKFFEQLTTQSKNKIIVVQNDEIDWNQIIYIHKQQRTIQTRQLNITPNVKWIQNGITIAGDGQRGNELNRLHNPRGLYIDDDQNIFIADENNHRIMKWKCGATSGQVIAGGNGKGDKNDQLNCPTNVIVDKRTDSLIICDQGNTRIVQWSCRGGTSGQKIISNIKSFSLKMDDYGFLYISDYEKHEVRRWRIGETQGTLVAGGNGKGRRLDQLNCPRSLFVDHNQSVYVSDYGNYRVMKWIKGAKEGIIVAGGQGKGSALDQLSTPRGLFVDQFDTVYVVDCFNNRIMCWPKGATQGSVVCGGNGQGTAANQFNGPTGLFCDQDGHLYVADYSNHRVQKFSIKDR